MGINNLHKFLRKNCSEIYEEIHLSEFAFKKVAIDISLYLCKFKTICGDRWLSAFLNLVACLRKNEIHCVFIYDNGAPPEKDEEKAERLAQREKMEERVCVLEEALNHFHCTGEIEEVLIELHQKILKGDSVKGGERRLLNRSRVNIGINMSLVESKIEKMRSQILSISPGDFELTRNLFDILDVPYYFAPLEAETMCADLCKRGLVDAVLSEDTDVLAYGCPIFLTKINTAAGTCVQLRHENILRELELTESEFLDLCIMCGTDYNKNIFRVGPEKAYKYIHEYKTIENIERNVGLDISVLKHVRCREIFTEYERSSVENIPYCGCPNFEELKLFVFKNNINLTVEGLRDAFVKNVVVFEE